jgi:hypothetical protein
MKLFSAQAGFFRRMLLLLRFFFDGLRGLMTISSFHASLDLI